MKFTVSWFQLFVLVLVCSAATARAEEAPSVKGTSKPAAARSRWPRVTYARPSEPKPAVVTPPRAAAPSVAREAAPARLVLRLQKSRTDYSLRKTSVALPATLLTLGGVTLLTGGIVFAILKPEQYCEWDYGREYCYEDGFPAGPPVGKGLMIAGASVALIGLIVLPIRLVARQRFQAFERSMYRAGASVSPWVSRENGSSFGLRGAMSF
jgi:hypothetical protein